MKKAKPFQLILLIVFIVIAVIAVAVFSNSDGKGGGDSGMTKYGGVVVWGTIPDGNISQLFQVFSFEVGKAVEPSYTYVPPEALDQRLLEALANGTGPDVLLLPSEWIVRNTQRITPIPYDSQKGGISGREFLDTYAQGGEIFLAPNGIIGLPLVVDPLVMYWNRDLFTNAGIATVPKKWEEFLELAPKLTKSDRLEINQSAVALGEFVNITHAEDILSLLFLQVGNPILSLASDNSLQSMLGRDDGPAKAVQFFTDFANPLKSIYTWNRSLPTSRDLFLSDRLAVFFDLASDYPRLVQANPRLNMDIAAVPQTTGQKVEVTTGSIHGLSVLKSAKNPLGAFAFVRVFTTAKYAQEFSDAVGLAPLRRDLLSVPQSDAYKAIFYDEALKARTWLNPDPRRTNIIFSQMIDAVTSGKLNPGLATKEAGVTLGVQPK